MKKVFYFAAVCAALVGCAKVEVREYVPDAKPIVFNSPVVGVPTKAMPDGYTTYTGGSFDVYALHTASAIATAYIVGTSINSGAVTAVDYFSGSKEFSLSDGSYKNATAFWPKSGFLTFHAFSPTGVANLTHTWGTYDTNYTGFTIPTAIEVGATDLMYSSYAYDKTSAAETESVDAGSVDYNSGYTGVDIVFHHALSAIQFMAKKGANVPASATYNITSITLKNDYYQGTFKENAPKDSWGAATPAWTVSGPERTHEATPAAARSIFSGTSADLTTVAANIGSQEIVLPQLLAHAAANTVTVSITYTETIGGNATTVGPVEIELNDAGWTYSEATTAWVPGKRYIYTITIGSQEIKLDPAVADWTDVTANYGSAI